MASYLDYLNVPAEIAIVLAIVFLVMQFIGELLELKGKTVPEVVKIRKYFARKKKERETLGEVPKTLRDVKELMADLNKHYSEDNISMRNQWMDDVEKKLGHDNDVLKDLGSKVDENSKTLLMLVIESKRNTILDFVNHITKKDHLVTHEQFNRILRIYREYEDILSENNLENGEVDTAIRIIREEYDKRMKTHEFIEDIRWGGDQIVNMDKKS